MVEFLKNVIGHNFSYEKGKRYVSMNDCQSERLKNKVLVRQSNSPKNKNWWTEFSNEDDGVLFKTLNDCEMSLMEIAEENKVLQY